jgi:hypothetical protein
LDSEAAVGHRVTYAMDTLKSDIRKAGLRIVTDGGIMFKALADFQLDAALHQGIITQDYLDGCFELGRLYPRLCSSIYAICGRNDVFVRAPALAITSTHRAPFYDLSDWQNGACSDAESTRKEASC